MEILLLLKLALMILSLLAAVCKSVKSSAQQSDQPKPEAQPVKKLRGKVSQSYRSDPKNRALQEDLLTLLRNDIPAAKRLLVYQRQLNPGKSDNWYLEKVIYDLERDRR